MAKEGEQPQADRPVADAVADTGPDDGLTPEERGQFETMRTDSSGPAPEPDAGAAPAEGAAADGAQPGGDAAAAAAAKGADGEADDDGDDEPAAGAQPGAPGAAPGAAGDKQPRRVSFSKYKRETEELRAKVAAQDGTISEQRANQARLDERLRIINEALATPQPGAEGAAPKQPPLPAAEDDPEPDRENALFEWLAWKDRDDKRFRQTVMQGQQRQQQTEQQKTESETISRTYLQDANAYAQQNPQFVPAYQFLMQSRTLELAEYFFNKDLTVEGSALTADELAKIEQTVATEERQLVTAAIKEKKSPAARVFQLAKARGFKPQAAAAKPAADPAALAANGAAKPDAAAAAAAVPGALNGGGQPNVREEIERVKNGQDAALSLSGGGAAPVRTLDAKTLASMSEEDFGTMMDSMSPAQWKAVAGG